MKLTRRNFLKTGLATLGSLALSKITKADYNSTILNPFFRPNINRTDTPYGDWNLSQTREEKIGLLNNFLAVDKTDEIPPIEKDLEWICRHYATLDTLKIFGYKKPNPEDPDIPKIFYERGELTESKIGEANFPVYYVHLTSVKLKKNRGSGAHAINCALVGDNPLEFNDWYFLEPQGDYQVNIGDWNMPDDSYISIEEIYQFFDDGTDDFFPFWLIDFKLNNGIPETPYKNKNLILQRPPIDPVSVTESKPFQFRLEQNYPNPFNSSTTIEYSLRESGDIKLEIYNLNGQRLETLVNENKSAGKHRINWNADNYSSGNYFYKLTTNNSTERKKMLLVK